MCINTHSVSDCSRKLTRQANRQDTYPFLSPRYHHPCQCSEPHPSYNFKKSAKRSVQESLNAKSKTQIRSTTKAEQISPIIKTRRTTNNKRQKINTKIKKNIFLIIKQFFKYEHSKFKVFISECLS